MEFLEKNKTLLIIGGVLILGVVVYFMFFSGGSSTAVSSSNSSLNPTSGGLVSELSATAGGSLAGGSELLSILAELKSITFDSSIFDDPLFLGLKDGSRPIPPEPFGKSVGRRNPFSNFGKTEINNQ